MSSPKTIFLPPKHENTKSHQDKSIEIQHFVQFGVLVPIAIGMVAFFIF